MNSNQNSIKNSVAPTNKSSKPTLLQAFFITCSGADKEIIYQCPTEFNKYAGIGATIFFTALLASFSGGYAIYTALFDATNTAFSQNVFLITAGLGILWGIIIFNLDRYIVLSLRKEKIPTKAEILNATSDFKKNELKSERNRMLWSQFWMVLPRFLIALVIALTISKPIELRLFKPRIDKELAKNVALDTKQFDIEFNNQIDSLNAEIQQLNDLEKKDKDAIYTSNPVYLKLITDIERLNNSKDNYETRIKEKDKIISKNLYLVDIKVKDYFDEFTKKWEYKTIKKWKLNSVAKAAKKDKDVYQKHFASATDDLENAEEQREKLEEGFINQTASVEQQYEQLKAPKFEQIEQLKNSYESRKKEWVATLNRSSDLLSRIEALSTISKFGNSAWWASLVITLLFVLLETAPVVVKLLTKRGPYDEILERIEYGHYLEEQKLISNYNFEVNKELEEKGRTAEFQKSEFEQKEKQRIAAELRDHQIMLDGMSERRKELSERAVDIWYEKELLKLQNEAKKYVNAPKWKVIENQVWKNINGTDTFYCFVNRDDNQVSKELWYRNGSSLRVGNWKYLNNNTALEINIGGQKEQYFITDLAQTKLGLKGLNNNGALELRKADNANII